MSFHQAEQASGLYLSFAGGLSPNQRALLGQVLTKHYAAEIVTATDNDTQGEEFAAFIQSIRTDAIRRASPVGKDWNDAINLK